MVSAPDAVAEVEDPKAKALARTIDSIFATLVLVVPFALRLTRAFAPVIDPDIWWHLAAGRWMVDHGSVPSVDPFKTGGVAHDWFNYSWLIDIVWWLGYRSIELAAPVAYTMVMGGVLLLLSSALIRRDGSSLVRRSFVAALGFLVIGTHCGPRTYLFTILFTGLVVLFIRRCRLGADPRRGLWLVPMFALWVNLHLEFFYALFFLGLASFDGWLKRRSSAEENRLWKWLAVYAALGLLATLANPFGARLHAMMTRMVGPYSANDLVIEMQASDFRSPFDYLMLLLFCAAIYTLARRGSRDLYSWGSLVVAGYMGFHSQRVNWLICVVALDILGDLPLFSRRPSDDGVPRLFRLSLPLAASATVLVATLLLIRSRESLVPRSIFPYAAASYVRKEGLAGPLYNDWNWGGFLRFDLPDVQGNIDGRGPIFGNEVAIATTSIWHGKPEWKSDPELASAAFVLGPTKSALTELLRFDPRFRKTYEDEVATIFVHEAH